MLTRQGLELVKHFESFRATVYRCPAGLPTIGYGHVLRKGENYLKGITQEEAEQLLLADIAFAMLAVRRLITVPLTPFQHDALVSFTYNCGSGSLQRSTLRRVINREDHMTVPEELLKWVKANGRTMQGLVLRRHAEAKLYLS
jgi:lysozyme